MSTTLPSRAAIDAAEPLSFETRKPARQDLTLTVKARVNGFDVDICFSGQLEQLDAITKRLAALGAEPVSAAPRPTSPAPNGKPKAKYVQPEYNADGDPLCPKHHKPLKAGSWGLYCSAKDDSTERGYCSIKFAE